MSAAPIFLSNQDMPRLDTIIRDSAITQPLITVYCGARAGDDPAYLADARHVGTRLAQAGIGVVYGGGSIGMMGAVADGALSAGGMVVGVIPEFLRSREIAHAGLSHLYVTDTMHTRKALMAAYASAFLVLAGGLGTLEEIMEIATWRQLYQHEKPMLILNTLGFYDGLITHLKHTADSGFMSATDLARLHVCPSVDAVMDIVCQVGFCQNADVQGVPI